MVFSLHHSCLGAAHQLLVAAPELRSLSAQLKPESQKDIITKHFTKGQKESKISLLKVGTVY